MATDNSTTPAIPEHVDVLNALLDIKGAVRLSQRSVSDASGVPDPLVILSCVDGVLTLAEAALERLYEQLDSNELRDAWPTVAEVTNG